jgi:hypothetical protein
MGDGRESWARVCLLWQCEVEETHQAEVIAAARLELALEDAGRLLPRPSRGASFCGLLGTGGVNLSNPGACACGGWWRSRGGRHAATSTDGGRCSGGRFCSSASPLSLPASGGRGSVSKGGGWRG